MAKYWVDGELVDKPKFELCGECNRYGVYRKYENGWTTTRCKYCGWEIRIPDSPDEAETAQ